MQGQQDFQRALFDTIDLELMIPRDHLLRRIDSKIDFGFIYDITERLYCSDNGRPSIDPVLFFRMQLIGYLYGMKSDRELCREVHLNLAFRHEASRHNDAHIRDRGESIPSFKRGASPRRRPAEAPRSGRILGPAFR